jgi:hypothetical protein
MSQVNIYKMFSEMALSKHIAVGQTLFVKPTWWQLLKVTANP